LEIQGPGTAVPSPSIILARLSGVALERPGSCGDDRHPVYIDGKLVGAVAMPSPSPRTHRRIRPFNKWLQISRRKRKYARGPRVAAGNSAGNNFSRAISEAGHRRVIRFHTDRTSPPRLLYGFTSATLERVAAPTSLARPGAPSGVSGGSIDSAKVNAGPLQPGSSVSVSTGVATQSRRGRNRHPYRRKPFTPSAIVSYQ